jgi:hypothetical protein
VREQSLGIQVAFRHAGVIWACLHLTGVSHRPPSLRPPSPKHASHRRAS